MYEIANSSHVLCTIKSFFYRPTIKIYQSVRQLSFHHASFYVKWTQLIMQTSEECKL